MAILVALLAAICVAASEAPSPTTTPVQAALAVAWPDTLAARRAKEFIEAVGAVDDAAMRRFEEAYRSPESLKEMTLEQRVARAKSLREQIGGIAVSKVVPDGEHAVEVFGASSKLKQEFAFRFVLAVEPPHYIVSIEVTPSGPAPAADAKPLEPWANVGELLEQLRKRSGVPALAAAIVRDGRMVEAAVVGVRAANAAAPAQKADLFHIGSLTKAMTSTMIGKLIEQGALRWDTKLSEVLSDVPMRPEYAGVTLAQLLQHRGGIRPYTDGDTETASPAVRAIADGVAQRRAFAAQVLDNEPVAPPGSAMSYSNAGYTLAAAMAERATGKSWEELMTANVFQPLGMTTAAFGWPASSQRPDQPRGHFDDQPTLRVQEFGEYDLGPSFGPPGDISCSIEDLGRFAAFHLAGLRGTDGVLRAATVARLHEPPNNERSGYACGWGIDRPDGGVERHVHNGSAGTFFAVMVLYPQENLAIVAAANTGESVKAVMKQIVTEIHDREVKRAPTAPKP